MRCPNCGTINLESLSVCTLCGMPNGPDLRDGPLADRIASSDYLAESPARHPVMPPLPALEPTPRSNVPPAGQLEPGWYVPAGPLSQASDSSPGAHATRTPLPARGSLAEPPPQQAHMLVCGVCGAAVTLGQRQCPRCQTPPGAIVNPNDPTATTFLPFGPPVPLTPLFRAGAETPERGPGANLRGWNWGAALLPTLWAANHRLTQLAVWSGLLSIALVSLTLLRAALHRTIDSGGTLTGFLAACALLFGVPRSLYGGLRGNTMAWRSGRYQDRHAMGRAQRSWAVWAIIWAAVLALLLGFAGTVLSRP